MRSPKRTDYLRQLQQASPLQPGCPALPHGRLYSSSPPAALAAPVTVWLSRDQPRAGQQSPAWVTASEYEDSPEALSEKVGRLVELLEVSERTVLYTGAGISTAAGISQAARSGRKISGGKKKEARPTVAHRALVALRERGLLHTWLQQNHDGLPQKAGWPQEDIVEIHGSWFDPSNPVVKYDGDLREDLYQRMRRAEEEADLVIVIGTSLSGLTSDQVAASCARRSLEGTSLGTVIINLQQTSSDLTASLRIFCPADRVLEAVLARLATSLPLPAPSLAVPPEERAAVPYDRSGRRTRGARLMVLDLRPGQAIRLNPAHNCQGARQPLFLHIGAEGRREGRGTVVGFSPSKAAWDLKVEGASMLLGGWWLQAAVRGNLETIPVININPSYSDLQSQQAH